MKRGIVWFKNDLRVGDNIVLNQALLNCDQVIPFYCINASAYKLNKFGFRGMGFFRTQFMLESLRDLDRILQKLGGCLIVAYGNPIDEIIKVVNDYGASVVYTMEEVGYDEIQINMKVKKILKEAYIEFITYSNSTLYREGDLNMEVYNISDVFTEFRKYIERMSKVEEAISEPNHIPVPSKVNIPIPGIDFFGFQIVERDTRAVIDFKGGESFGLERIQQFIFGTRAINTYKQNRNALLGENNSSKLSPWLSMGCISPRQVYHEVKKYEKEFVSNESTYWLIFELLWRDFFWFMMKKHKHLYFLKEGIKGNRKTYTSYNQTILNNWVSGETENDFIDANMIELKQTGFMSNRGRQNVASFLCHNLNMDWRYGAAYFQEALIDFDVSSNWCNWAYIAGVGNDPRGVRTFNIEKQSKEYDSNYEYRKHWLIDRFE